MEIKIPGFRPGKAPKPIIDAQVGRDVVLEEFVHQLVPDYFHEAVTDEDLAPIGDPEVDVEQLEPGKSFIFTATVEVRPRLDLAEAQYAGVKVLRPTTEPTDEEIEAWIERLQRQFAELEPVERPAQETDLVTISLSATRSGASVEELTREGYLYSVGSGEFGETLDAKILGAKPGDIIEFDEELPAERYGEELAGPATFRVLVKEIKALRLPEPDDAFASTASEFDTIAELREDLREKLREVKGRDADGIVRDRVLQALVDDVDVDLPDSLIEGETEHRVRHAEQRPVLFDHAGDAVTPREVLPVAQLVRQPHVPRVLVAAVGLEDRVVVERRIPIGVGERRPREIVATLARSSTSGSRT